MPTIHNAVLIGAPIETVFRAITTSEGLSAWWTPNAIAEAKLNSIAYFPFGEGYAKEMEIIALESFNVVKWKCIKATDQWIGTTISFDLRKGDKKSFQKLYPDISGQVEQLNFAEGTLLIFKHMDWKEETLMFSECSYTWGQFLKSLKLYCETGIGRPYPTQHN